MEQKRSEKELEARNSLPEELRPVFDEFVADYRFAATGRYGKTDYDATSKVDEMDKVD